MKTKYFYLEWDNQTDAEIQAAADSSELVEFQSSWDTQNLSYIAEDAAQDRFYDAGGDLANPMDWPRKFYIFDTDKKYLGLFSVNMEYSPDFHAERVTTRTEVPVAR